MTSLDARRALRSRIIAQLAADRSYRTQAVEDYGDLSLYSTLNKIVLYGRFPKDEQKLIKLGLKQVRRARELTPMQKRIKEKSDELREQLKAWKRKKK